MDKNNKPTLTWPVFLSEDHPHQDPKLEQYWEQFFGALMQMQEFCTNNEIDLKINLIPMDTQVSKHYWDKYAIRYFGAEEQAADRPQNRILKYCKEQNLNCLDLLPYFRDNVDRDQLYFQNEDPHFDIKGHALTAEILRKALLQNK